MRAVVFALFPPTIYRFFFHENHLLNTQPTHSIALNDCACLLVLISTQAEESDSGFCLREYMIKIMENMNTLNNKTLNNDQWYKTNDETYMISLTEMRIAFILIPVKFIMLVSEFIICTICLIDLCRAGSFCIIFNFFNCQALWLVSICMRLYVDGYVCVCNRLCVCVRVCDKHSKLDGNINVRRVVNGI